MKKIFFLIIFSVSAFVCNASTLPSHGVHPLGGGTLTVTNIDYRDDAIYITWRSVWTTSNRYVGIYGDRLGASLISGSSSEQDMTITGHFEYGGDWGYDYEGRNYVNTGTLPEQEDVQQDRYTFSDVYINNSDVSKSFEVGIFDENGNLIKTKSFWVEPGDMVDFSFVSSEPFSVGVRETSEESDGWITNEWSMEDAALTATDADVDMDFPVVQKAGLYGEGANNPNLPYNEELDQDGQQIIDAIEASVGNTNARHDALLKFIDYMNSANSKVRANMLQAINDSGQSILDAIEGLTIPNYSGDFANIATAQATIRSAVNDLDSAVEQWASTTGNANTQLQNRSDEIKAAVDALGDTITDDSAKLDELSATLDNLYGGLFTNNPYATAEALQLARDQISDLKDWLIANGKNSDLLNDVNNSLDSFEANFLSALTSELEATEGAINANIDGVKDLISDIRQDTEQTNPKIDSLATKLDELKDIVNAGFDDDQAMLDLIESIETLATSIVDADSSAEILQMGDAIQSLGAAVRDMNFTGDLDSSILGRVADVDQSVNAVGEAVTLTGNSVADGIDTTNSILREKLDALIAATPDYEPPIDYTEKFNTIIANQEIANNQFIDYTPKIDEVIQTIKDIPEPSIPENYTSKFDEIISNQEEQIQSDVDRDSDNGTLGRIANALDPDVNNIQVPSWLNDYASTAKDRSLAAEGAISSQITEGLTPIDASGTFSSNGAPSFPVVTLPILGTLDTDPFKKFTWLDMFADWMRSGIIWASSFAFLLAFYRFLHKSTQEIMNTPLQLTSGGGMTGIIASLKQATISALFLGVIGTLIVGYMTWAQAPLLPIISMATGNHDLAQGAPSPVIEGIKLITLFIPMDHIINLAAMTMIYTYGSIPACIGIQAVMRVFTI